MTPEQREELTDKIGGMPMKFLTWIQLMCLIAFIGAVFILIWHSWQLGLKVGASSFILALISGYVYNLIKRTISEEIEKMERLEKEQNPPVKVKSKFQIKLEQLAKEKGISI